MNTNLERWRAADAVLAQLLDLPESERASQLASLSLAEDVRAAVAQLLHAHEHAGLLDRPIGTASSSLDVALVGRTLGRWRLREEIGRGGMSVVHRAQAVDAPEQVAAVKLLTMGALAGDGAARFRHEQLALARLRHPHIATLLDAGVADDGTPWMAMSLVEGVRIDAWCAERALDPSRIVALILQVCDAMAYAHRNLVVHRDLKPSNVLVDREGHVRVLDFGIARLLDDAAEATASQWRALTPDYAAPEQFSGAAPSTAIDVYGLGALAYRLLAGVPPRRADTSPGAMPLPASHATRDARRAARLRGDLDVILTKALATEPAQRYATVSALAEDLDAWLTQRPVRARGPGMGYRIARFVVRHRVAVAAGAAVLMAMLVGTALALWQAQRAQAQSMLAAQQASRAASVRDFLVSLFDAADPERPDGAVLSTRDVVALGALRAREELAQEPALRAEMLRVIGSVQRRLGDLDAARTTLTDADAAATQAGATQAPLEYAQLRYEQGVVDAIRGEVDASVRAFDDALARVVPLADRAGGILRAQVMGELALAAQQRSEFDTALIWLDRADAELARLDPPNPVERSVAGTLRVSVLNTAGRYAEAAALATALVEQARADGLDNRASFAKLLANASKLATAVGDAEHAIAYAEEGLRVAQTRYAADDPAVAAVLLALGNAYRSAGRHAEAASALGAAYRRLAQGNDDASRNEAAMLWGRALIDLGEMDQALTVARTEIAADRGDEAARLRMLGLLDVALRAARATDAAAYTALAADLVARLDGLPASIAALPMTQRARRRLAQWQLEDRQYDAAWRTATAGIEAAGPASSADVLIMRACAVRALQSLRRTDEATAAFAALADAAAATPSLKPIEAETRLAIAQAAVGIGHADRETYVRAAEQAHAATPMPPALTAQLAALRRQ